jgi:hypothetical protein
MPNTFAIKILYRLFLIKLLTVLMQLGCRALKNCKFIENKGKSDDFSEINRMKNCAISDAVAQPKMKWRSFGGTFEFGDMHLTSVSVPTVGNVAHFHG